ncbi:putative tyrosinase-like protein tyr-3 [Dreissena polymorpha]|nr:putative tyrosinase-like protein tyr-3 [Dreissena polymorpha]
MAIWIGLLFDRITCQPEICLMVPPELKSCYENALRHPITSKAAIVDCLQRLLWFFLPDRNQTRPDVTSFVTNNAQRYPIPLTGFRVRKEYRRLTDYERVRLHNALNSLYKKGVIRKYGQLYADASGSTHGGPAFLSWHRVFLARFEDELRKEEGTIALPYWDCSLDFAMDNPVNSVLWADDHFGNANGDVVVGPFANWMTTRGKLTRNYGNRGVLIDYRKMKNIINSCNTKDITFPLEIDARSELDGILEYHSNGVNNWVGGDMTDASFAAYDPVFYMHLAFIDFIWERFRENQANTCQINPENAYASPPGYRSQQAEVPMYGFSELRNIDGLMSYWTKTWYAYEPRPRCPDCGSKYLFCNMTSQMCISHSRRTDFNAGKRVDPLGAIGAASNSFEPRSVFIPKRSIYPFTPSPESDGRLHSTALDDAKETIARLQTKPETTTSRWLSLAQWVKNLEPLPVGVVDNSIFPRRIRS